jgi:hypothetical protein
MKRRHVLAALLAAAMASSAAAQQAPATLRYAVLSAVGDQMTVVRARTQTGSRLDRNDNEVAEMPDRALDRLVLKHADGALKRSARRTAAGLVPEPSVRRDGARLRGHPAGRRG